MLRKIRIICHEFSAIENWCMRIGQIIESNEKIYNKCATRSTTVANNEISGEKAGEVDVQMDECPGHKKEWNSQGMKIVQI